MFIGVMDVHVSDLLGCVLALRETPRDLSKRVVKAEGEVSSLPASRCRLNRGYYGVRRGAPMSALCGKPGATSAKRTENLC
jgi:hypothetical protein